MAFRPDQSFGNLQVQNLRAGSIDAVRISQDGSLAPSQATLDVAAGDLPTLSSAPVEVIPSPGPGKAILVIAGLVKLTVVHTFPGGGNALRLVYGSDGDALAANTSVRFQLIGSKVSAFYAADDLGPDDSEGVEDQGIFVKTADDPGTLGSVLTSAVNAPGTGYAPGDNVAIGIQHWIIDTVDGGGGVLTFHQVTPSDLDPNHAIANNLAADTATGSGTGLTIDILTIQPGEATMRIVVDYSIVDLAA